MQLMNKRRNLPRPKYQVISFSINAKKLERWLLKTLINLTFDKGVYIGMDSTLAGYPSDKLVEICFGESEFSGKAGMYFSSKTGAQMSFRDSFSFCPLFKDGKYVVGGFFVLCGSSFYLSLQPETSEFPLPRIENTMAEWRDGELSKPFRVMRLKIDDVLSHIIRFNWS